MSPHQRFCPDCGTTIGERPPRLIRCADCRLARYRTFHSGSLRQHPVSPVDFDPFRNSIIPTSTIPQGQSSIIDLPSSGKRPANQLLCPRAKRPALFQHDNAQGILHQAIEFLRLEHGERVAASNAFPPEIPPSRIRESLASYEEEIAAASKTSACCSCGRLVCVADIYQVGNRDSLLRPLEGSLDHCGRHGDQWDLCSSCHAALMRGTIPKFSATNLVNVTLCQHYPDELEDLTLSEEYLIAKCHPLGVVVKLRPGGRSSPVNYHALRGHFIVIPQDPGPLLQILPSPELRLHTLIKVFWLGNRPPTDTDLNPFLLVRKQRVLAALHYLVCHNQVYSGVTINHPMMDEWADDFIPTELRDSIVRVDDTDHHEREGYTVNLQEGNYENDFQAAETDPSDPAAGALLMTGSVTTDINGERQNPDLRILDTLMDLVANRSQVIDVPDHRRTPLIRYTIGGRATLVNHWDDPLFFTAAFPTLFPTGVGGHLEQRKIAVSVPAFAQWALTHHSRRHVTSATHSFVFGTDSPRFAHHKTFMYLLYDVIQLRGASLGNSLLVKRHHWRSVSRDIECLTVVQLKNAAEALTAGRNIENPTIKRLLRHIAIIGVRVPGSFSQKMLLRSQARGLTVREGMLAIWLTLNPSDLQSPLVLILAGREYDSEAFPAATAAVRQAVATSNPVAVAQFFHHTCKAILDGLLRSKSGGIGIFGDVSNYFGVVETNGRGMLHLHTLVWVRGNLRFTTLRQQVLNDNDFAARMIRYLETIIVQSIDDSKPDHHEGGSPNIPSSASGAQSDPQFLQALADDANYVARKKQIHSRHHSATCFKYRPRGTGKSPCRFGMPRDLVSKSKVDDLGMIHLSRNHAWITPWNPAIASCIRSNHDISWVPTVSKSLSLLYYITNYATKDDVSPLQVVLKASLLKQSIDCAKSTESPTATDLRLREKGMDSFALRCFNALSHDREVSGVQVASTLLQLPSYYTVNYNFMRINLWWLKRHVRAVIQPNEKDRSSDLMAEEPCTYDNDTAPASIFDNYKWRGPHLASLALFEYGMLVRTKSLGDSIAADFDFDAIHPRYGTHVQRIARTRSQVATVTLVGQLTEFQAAEDSVPGGNPTTTAIANDIAEVLLGLFVPWQQIEPHFQYSAAATAAKRHACAQVWATIEPMLAPHIQNFARNVDLLRKSKEDCRADAELWKRSGRTSDSFDRDMDDMDLTDLGTENDEPSRSVDETFNANTLIAAFHSICKSWIRESLASARHISVLRHGLASTQDLRLQNLQPLNICNTGAWETSCLRFLPPSTLQDWESQLKSPSMYVNRGSTAHDAIEDAFELDDFNLYVGDGILHPALADSSAIPTLVDRRSKVNNRPTGASLTTLVAEDIPLNKKQRMVVGKILSEALVWADHPYDPSRRQQSLLYVGGEGGVGKSQIIKAIVSGMDLIFRKEEVILMAPTGAAADNIGGNTYHTSLGISINRSQRTAMSARVRNLWARKTIMIVDEVSMVDLGMLSVIDSHCKTARSLHRDSTDFFGGLPVVILMGDFFQFPPVRGPPLWKIPRNGKDKEQNGQLIWHQFKQVILLDEQMRQAEDPPFRDLLNRARSATMSVNDLILLNSKAITSLVAPGLDNATTVVKLNAIRQQVNRAQMENFARSRGQKIFAFAGLHTRTKSTGPTNLRLHADDLLGLPEQGTKIPFPGLFLYSPAMPVALLTNICTHLGLVNGATGTAVGVIIDPTAEFYEIDDLFILCTRPPACVLFRPHKPKSATFTGLEPADMPVFPFERSITVKGYSVRRKQVPLCPAFCLTDYKVQGSTLTSAILDLKANPKARGQDHHKNYCSTYVQLSRLRSLRGLHLLQRIEMKDLDFRPDPQLLDEMRRLQDLEKDTIDSWNASATI